MLEFLPVAILFGFSIIVCLAIYGLTVLLGPKVTSPAKLTTYECGVKPEGSARQPFKHHFYLIAVLFLLFDVEAAFFLPWALIYKESLATGATALVAMGIFFILLVLGLCYELRKGGLKLD